MNFGLSYEQQMIVDTVRNFVENEIYPFESDVEATGIVPKEVAEEIKRKIELKKQQNVNVMFSDIFEVKVDSKCEEKK